MSRRFRYAGAPVDLKRSGLTPPTDDYHDLVNAISLCQEERLCHSREISKPRLNRPDIKSRNVEMRNELDLSVNRVLQVPPWGQDQTRGLTLS